MNIERVKKLQDELKDKTLVVASKYASVNDIIVLFDLGINDFGENRTDAFLAKYEVLCDYNINWHFIGHLQTNKAKDIIDKIEYLHSLDSIKLASMINRLRKKPLKCFVEVHATDSETKSGVTINELESFLKEVKRYPMVDVIGLMTMTDATQSDEEKFDVFKKVSDLAKQFGLKELSMGMSEDYKLAIQAGATFVRLGKIICK